VLSRAVLCFVLLAATACAAAAPAPTSTSVPTVALAATPTSDSVGATGANGSITVSAAASLTDAFKEIGTAFEAQNPGTKVNFNFGSSAALRAQLDEGAKAEVFASADQTQMGKAVQGGDISGGPKVFATNRLTIIVPSDNPKGIASLQDLAKPGVKIVAAQPGVPVGQYAQQILAKASQDATYGSDFRSKVEANDVSHESDVRQVVTKVTLGEGDAAIVYLTDVTPQSAPKVKVVPIPDSLNVIASYPIATVKTGSNPETGGRFVDFVLSPDGQKILAKWGFGPPLA
jgi:molybdate transport system substrate-binding protein